MPVADDWSRSADNRPAVVGNGAGPHIPPGNPDDLRPGDDYNQRASWDDILAPHGWRRTRKTFRGDGAAWTRPGKEHGVSATTGTSGDGVDRLYVFSTSTEFDAERPYSKFAAHAILDHGGDLSKAAAALRHDGYGAPLEQPRPALTWSGTPQTSTAVERQAPIDTTSANAPSGTVAVAPPGPSAYSLTDDGNALRLVDGHGEHVRFCPQRKLWLYWDGHRWIWDEGELIRENARGVARDLPAGNKVLNTFKEKSLGEQRIAAMVRLARSDRRVVVELTRFDAQPYQLNTLAGPVDLHTGKLLAADPAMLHTRSTTIAPDFEAAAPRWERFLAETFAGDPELTTYVQRLLGVSLIGQVVEQMLPFPYGAGANGKTTLLGVTQRLVGIGTTGYAISAPAEVLLATRNSDHPATIAQFSGARIVVTSELEEGQRFAENRVKLLTGRDPINARFMATNPFTFVPTHTLWLLANHKPNVKVGGPAFWRRIVLLPFVHTVPPERRDPNLEDWLVDHEGPAILAWLIQGCRDYLSAPLGSGLVTPQSVSEATAAYRLDQDTLTRFVTDMCEVGPHTDPLLRTKVSDLRGEYERWCHYEGEAPVNHKVFTQNLRILFDVYSERSATVRWYAGIRIKETSSDDTEDTVARDSGPNPWE